MAPKLGGPSIMRILLSTPGAPGVALEAALLQLGHHVFNLEAASGPLARFTLWPARKAAAAFRPDLVMDTASTSAPRLANRLRVPFACFDQEPAFLHDPFLPSPFVPTLDPHRPPLVGIAGRGTRAALAAVAHLPITAFALAGLCQEAALSDLDMVLLTDDTPAMLATAMAATRPIIAPDTPAARVHLTHGQSALLGADYLAAIMALTDDPTSRIILARTARAAYSAYQKAAWTALQKVISRNTAL